MGGKPTTLIIGGLIGTGSTTVAKLVADALGYEHVYAGGIFRNMATEAGQSLEDFMAGLADDPDLERSVDDRLLRRSKDGTVVLESRVLAWLVPDNQPSYRIWLVCDFPERVRRVNQREQSDDVMERLQYREAVDIQRYRRLYNLDLTDHSVFDQIVDTTKIPADEVAARIITSYGAV